MKLFNGICILVTLASAGCIDGLLSELSQTFLNGGSISRVSTDAPIDAGPTVQLLIVSDDENEVMNTDFSGRPVTIFFLEDNAEEVVSTPVKPVYEPLILSPPSPEVVTEPVTTVQEEEAATTECITAVEGMRIAGDFTLFLEALEITDLIRLFEDPELVGTLFAVQDKYFNAALGQFNLDAETFFGDAFLDRVMAYHVVNEVVLTEDMVEGEPIATALPNAELFVNRDDADGIEIVPIVTQFNATLLEKDISLCAAIVHVIDNLLIPSFNEEGDALPHPGIDVDAPLTPTIVDEPAPVAEAANP
eukprot:TRINITY_DN1838_c0_g1_i2.p1 TRINITY_DN1838_c0_g1~~TRINITY_DN1838_c0_g1_i2.p1  ORF type:complete len:305 (+),score=74.52 TRINITY_DN1838_c0_g1_i2:133-1047(+)